MGSFGEIWDGSILRSPKEIVGSTIGFLAVQVVDRVPMRVGITNKFLGHKKMQAKGLLMPAAVVGKGNSA